MGFDLMLSVEASVFLCSVFVHRETIWLHVLAQSFLIANLYLIEVESVLKKEGRMSSSVDESMII